MESLQQTATEKQCSYLRSLLVERPTWATVSGIDADEIATLSKTEASQWIEAALAVERETEHGQQLPGALPVYDLKEGSYWTLDGQVARVRRSKEGRRLYAETLDPEVGSFEYAPGTIYRLAKRMTLEEAKEWGARVGRCCVCATRLTDQKSVEMGIGPVCRKYLQ